MGSQGYVVANSADGLGDRGGIRSIYPWRIISRLGAGIITTQINSHASGYEDIGLANDSIMRLIKGWAR
jgi:hypothetical protein